MTFYPPKISSRFHSSTRAGEIDPASANGAEVDFTCGVSLNISLAIDEESKTITAAKFRTNGCGFVIAAADMLAERLSGIKLVDLHGLADLEYELLQEFDEIPENRKHCFKLALGALHNSLVEYRNTQIAEWEGEKALICTCFGVSEDEIESAISRENLTTVDEVGICLNAGTGCGSCQLLIREILDSTE